MTNKLTDFPKIKCPFIRRDFKVNEEQWREHGHSLQLRTPNAYLVIDQVSPDYEWVFDDPDTIAVEKLNGTNIKLLTENGRLIVLMNRKNIIDPLQIIKGKTFIIEGIFTSIQKGYIEMDGEQTGELIGPSVQANPYKLDHHLWYPFTKAIKHLSYRSFHEHDRIFDNWSLWFKDWLVSRFATKRNIKDVLAEGVVFYNLKRKEQGLTYMAKLRRDMFEWFYSDEIEIIGYDKNS